MLTRTAQVATNFSQELLATLPTTRDLNAVMLLAPSVHATGPNGNFSIAGAMSYENLFMVNGGTINENLRGQAYNLYIEDAIQETTVATTRRTTPSARPRPWTCGASKTGSSPRTCSP